MNRVQLLLPPHPNTTPDDITALERILTSALDQLAYGDKKYGRHPGPKRAFGALRNEFNELQTEIEAEDGTYESIMAETVQVIAMGIKLARDYKRPASTKQPDESAKHEVVDDVTSIRQLFFNYR